MSKNVKIIIILAIAALVIGFLIYFYKKNKSAAKASGTATDPTPLREAYTVAPGGVGLGKVASKKSIMQLGN